MPRRARRASQHDVGMPQTILITGGAGTLGRATAGLLLARGDRVRVLDLVGPALAEGIEVIRGDVRKPEDLRRAMNRAGSPSTKGCQRPLGHAKLCPAGRGLVGVPALRFARSVAVAVVATLIGWLVLASPMAASSGTAPTATFSFSARGSLSYAPQSGWNVGWTVVGTGVAAQRLIERVANADVNGGCNYAKYAKGIATEAVASPVRRTGVAYRCHRYRVLLLSTDGTILATARSGSLRILSDWTGRKDLYRPGVFSTQRTFSWCVGASIQMMLNMILGRHDHSYASQLDYMAYARAHDHDTGILGTNALGWRLALNHYAGTTGYDVHTYGSMRMAIRKAAKRLRITGHPVGLLVMHGHHAWVMSGFRATADPAVTNRYEVTSVYVEGPLYPIGQRDGFDMPPDTLISTTLLRSYMNPYQAPGTSWDHKFLTVAP